MRHVVIDRCDILDLLEIAVRSHHPVEVELRDGQRFRDQVRDIHTTGGEDYIEFQQRPKIPLTAIASCVSER